MGGFWRGDGGGVFLFMENLYIKHRYVPPKEMHYQKNPQGITSVIWNIKIQKWCSLVYSIIHAAHHIGYHDVFLDAVKDVARAGMRQNRGCIGVYEAVGYFEKFEPEYLESLKL